MNNWKTFPRVIVICLLAGLLVGFSAPVVTDQSASAAPMRAPLYGCPASTIAQWTFTNTVNPSTGSGTFLSGTGLTPLVPPGSYQFLTSTPSSTSNPSIYFSGWNTTAALDPNDYLEFQVDTSGKNAILFNFDYRSTGSGPTTLEIHYTDGINPFAAFSTATILRDSAFHSLSIDFSSIPALNNNSNVKFRIYAYGGGAGNFGVDNVTISDICIPPPPGTGNISIVNKVNNLDSVSAGVCANVVFTLAVTNDGSSDATNIQVKDVLPPQLQYVSDNSGMKYDSTIGNPTSGNWDVGTLLAGSTKTLSITAKLIASGLSITNHAQVLSSTSANNADDSTINSVPGTNADLQVVQTWNRSTSAVDTVNLVITVSNPIGPDLATGVQVEDKLPAGLTYVSSSFTPTNTGMTYSSSTGIWSVGNIANGGSATLTITAKVDQDGTSTTNVAKILSSNQCDLNVANNEVSKEVLIADLSLSEKVDISGSNAVFTITVTNSGPDDASGIIIKNSTLALPANYVYVSNGATAGSYNSGTGDWTIPTLLDGTTSTLTVTTTIVSSAVNWAQVTAVNEVDPNSVPGNCFNTVASCKEDDDASAPSADLSLAQSVNNPNPDLSTNVIFTLKVSNAGPAPTTGVQVKDNLPSGLTYVSDTSGVSGGTYSSTTGIWTVGALASGASQTLNITATVATLGIKTNVAEVSASDQADPDSTPSNGNISEDDYATASITSYRSIIINEIAWAGTAASSDDEWMELYNPSSSSINITGWTLISKSGSMNITLSGTISSGGYFLLERGANSTDNSTISDITADQIYTGYLLSNTGETLILNDSLGHFIDTANGDGGAWSQGFIDSNYGSMERQGISAETDASWVTNRGNPRNGINAINGLIYGTPRRANSTGLAPYPTPTPEKTPIPTFIPLVGRPIINEFLPRPGFDWNQDGKVNTFDEFIEIKNIGQADISLSGWTLNVLGSNPYSLPAVTLKIGERKVFYGLQTNLLLKDGGDTVRLINPNGKIYDAYTYDIAKVEDRSICRLPDGNGSWYEDCIPTPNFTNSREGVVPSMPGGKVFESPVCDLPDTLPFDFLFAECRGYGADIWHSFYWDKSGWQGDHYIPANSSKWESFVQ